MSTISERAIAASKPPPPQHKPHSSACPTCGYRKRSRADHNMLFAVCRWAAAAWPENHKFQPQGEDDDARGENLRGWLAVEAGYVDTVEYTAETEADVEKLLSVLRPIRNLMLGTTGYVRMLHRGDKVLIVSPKSMDSEHLDKSAFERLRRAMYDIIEAETGVKVDELKNHAHSA